MARTPHPLWNLSPGDKANYLPVGLTVPFSGRKREHTVPFHRASKWDGTFWPGSYPITGDLCLAPRILRAEDSSVKMSEQDLTLWGCSKGVFLIWAEKWAGWVSLQNYASNTSRLLELMVRKSIYNYFAIVLLLTCHIWFSSTVCKKSLRKEEIAPLLMKKANYTQRQHHCTTGKGQPPPWRHGPKLNASNFLTNLWFLSGCGFWHITKSQILLFLFSMSHMCFHFHFQTLIQNSLSTACAVRRGSERLRIRPACSKEGLACLVRNPNLSAHTSIFRQRR